MKIESQQKTRTSKDLKKTCQNSKLGQSVPIEFQHHFLGKQTTEAISVKTDQTENLKETEVGHVCAVDHKLWI